MQFVLLEDDPGQSDWLIDDLRSRSPKVDIQLLTSEHEFRSALDSFRGSQPDLFILDVMVRWTKPEPNMELPSADAGKEKYFRAGVRCAELLRREGFSTPIILYTILENVDIHEDLERLRAASDNIVYIRKESTSEELLRQIREKVKAVT